MVTYLVINYNDSTYNSFKNRLGYAGALKKEGESGFATLR
jgi:ABC-type Fe2+-enterobactin transport system substrate-binding protein